MLAVRSASDTPSCSVPTPLHPIPDLPQFLAADPTPTFLLSIHPTEPIPFEILLSNHAFQKADGLDAQVRSENTSARLFRAWAQATAHWSNVYTFAGRAWTAFAIEGRYKVVRSTGPSSSTGKPQAHYRRPSRNALSDAPIDPGTVDARFESMQRMMEMSDVGVFEYHPSGTLMRANESWYRLSRHPREGEAHQDFSFMDLVYPPDVPLVMAQWNKLSQGMPLTFEMRWKAPLNEDADENGGEHGGFQWVLSACVPVLNNEGKLISIAGNTIDISAQKRVQWEALKRAEALELARSSEQKFTRFAELAPVAIFISDPSQAMMYCNHQFFELTGHPHVEPAQVDWVQLVLPEDVAILEARWETLTEEKQPAQAQFRLRRKWVGGDGTTRQAWAQLASYPECDAQGNVISIFGVLNEITKFKWAEDIQQTRVNEALEAKRQQENFIDMTSHEMRNPLSAVIQCADSSIEAINQIAELVPPAIPGDTLKKVQQEIQASLDALQTIVSCCLHQRRVIDDILTLSKLDSSLILITPVAVQPVAVVAKAVKMFEVECLKEGIALKLVQHESLKKHDVQWVMMDPSRSLQILINLLTNAIKFSRDRPVKSITVSIGASLEPLPPVWKGITFAPARTTTQSVLDKPEWGTGDKMHIWITVEDTGCGISPAEQRTLFTRFTQATPRTHVQYGGSGLGLFISKSLTELQDGSIGVRSEANVGSTFAFSVGTRVASAPEGDTQGSDLARNKTLASIQESVKAAHYSVLIVEDNLVNQKVLSRQLQKAGCEVFVAGHGQEALDFLQTTTFWHTQTRTGRALSVVLMDIEMPVMDGLACVRRIRELQDAGDIVGHIPVLAVSANVRTEQVRRALDAGMDDSIGKPFRIQELLPKIEYLADRYTT